MNVSTDCVFQFNISYLVTRTTEKHCEIMVNDFWFAEGWAQPHLTDIYRHGPKLSASLIKA